MDMDSPTELEVCTTMRVRHAWDAAFNEAKPLMYLAKTDKGTRVMHWNIKAPNIGLVNHG